MGATDPVGSGVLTYAWDFGDGTTGQGEIVTKTYSAAGKFTATVTVTGGTGTATSTVDITVDDGLNVSTAEKKKFTLNFATNMDSIDITIDNAALMDVADGDKIMFSIGDPADVFDEAFVIKGKAAGSLGKFSVSTSKGNARYAAKIAVQDLLAPYGATDDTKTQLVMVPIFITINADVFGGTFTFNYTATQNKSGQGK